MFSSSLVRRSVLILSACVLPHLTALAQPHSAFTEKVRQIMSRPEFAHANFGMEFLSLQSGSVVYALDPHKLFVPASTTKLLTEGTLLAKFGPEHRFRTPIYRTGPIGLDGTLRGDLVLVASGDPNLSNRVRADGSLGFENLDHSYGGAPVPGDPLVVIRNLAQQVVAKNVRRIEGRVLVDTALFKDTQWQRDTEVVISSIMVNDNIVNLLIKPGRNVGDPTVLEASPQTSYVTFINHVVTGPARKPVRFRKSKVLENEDGSLVVTLEGNIPQAPRGTHIPFFVPSPTRFAQTVLREALASLGVEIRDGERSRHEELDPVKLEHFYVPENRVAEHVSPAFAEEVKVTLKVSQNGHAFMGPYLLGALIAKDKEKPFDAGFGIERAFLQSAGLNLAEASQGDGAGGDPADLFSPDFMCRYLAYMATLPHFETFLAALPVMGRDGTLVDVQVKSPAAGHVYAKTGTYGNDDMLNGVVMLSTKGLAGYLTTASGHKLALAVYVNHVRTSDDPDLGLPEVDDIGNTLGEIATAAYESF